MEKECHDNIINLHVFIESWLKGTVEQSQQNFQYFEDVLHTSFIIIHPGGERQNKTNIMEDFRGAYGVKNEKFKIEIKNITTRLINEKTCLLTYEEWQTDVEEHVRISTVLFQKSDISKNMTWYHLHETWCSPNNQ